jgi:hypothetical protein|tara:strand:- start:32 stop:451 length:420 start_codon:yes stop_codon:yes gene_type:complete
MNEEEFIGVIKLISGEEIVGKISHSENGGKIILECPAVMNSSIDRQVGVNVVKIEPWIKTGRETSYVLDMNKIVTIIEVVDKEVTRIYSKFVMAYYFDNIPENFSENTKSITKEMGYISSVQEARIMLEKIFNSDVNKG